jgi:hypothetical protein
MVESMATPTVIRIVVLGRVCDRAAHRRRRGMIEDKFVANSQVAHSVLLYYLVVRSSNAHSEK